MNKKVKAAVITIISLGVVSGAVYGGIVAYQHVQDNKLTAKVVPVSNLNWGYVDEGVRSSGVVTNDHSQEVYPLDGKEIIEVYVQEGDTVKEGDPLIAYDMKMSDLELEMKELDVSVMENKLEAAKKDLEKLKKMKPISTTPTPVPTPEPPQPDPVPVTPQEPTLPEKTGKAFNYIKIDSKPNKGKGTEEEPYVFLCMPDCYVLGEYINSLSADKKNPVFVRFEIHKKNEIKGKLQHVWEVSGKSGMPVLDGDSKWSVKTRAQIIEEEPEEPEIPEEPEPEPEPEIPEQPQGYTAEELARKIKDKEGEIRDFDLDYRKAQLEYEQLKSVSSDGIIKATLNGVVKSVGEADNMANGSPFITVAGSEGLYVSGAISELQLNDVQEGQTVYANSWESGKNFEAKITEISPYPSTGSDVWGEGNPNVSYYPYTAYIENTEGLRNGEYVELTMSGNKEDSSTLYIQAACVREEDGRKYVLKADENDRLVKQYVKTGKTIWGQAIEIISGLSMEDRIAFPYGKTAKEGVKVEEADSFESQMMY